MYDWNTIRKDYLAGESLKAISDKYDISYGTVRNQAMNQDWKSQKIKLYDEIITRIADSEAEEIKAMKLAEREDILNLSHIIQEQIQPNLHPQLIQQLTTSYEKVQKMLYKSYGISDKIDMNHSFEEDTEFKIIKK
jgi:hypothetical protein